MRKLLAIGVIGAIALGVIGWLHTPAAIALFGGCPFGGAAGLSPEVREANRLAANASLRGEGVSGHRIISKEFELGVTTESDLRAWAMANGGQCGPGFQGLGLRCETSDSQRIVSADFGPSGTLVALSRQRYVESAQPAIDAWSRVDSSLSRHLGRPDRAYGEATGAYLDQGTLAQLRHDYRREDLLATASATNLGPERYLVTDTYRLLD